MSELVLYKNVDVSKFKFTKPQQNKYATKQLMGFINYNGAQTLIVQTPVIHNKFQPIAKIGDYTPSDYACTKDTSLHLNLDIPHNKMFYDKIVEIDNWVGSDEFKKVYFPQNPTGYDYQPIMRCYENKEKVKHYHIKAKMDVQADKQDNITAFKTTIYTLSSVNPVEYSSLEELRGLLPTHSEMQCLIHFQKIYVQIKKEKGTNMQRYGITLKIKQINITSEQAPTINFTKFQMIDDPDAPVSIVRKTAELALNDNNSDDDKNTDDNKSEADVDNKSEADIDNKSEADVDNKSEVNDGSGSDTQADPEPEPEPQKSKVKTSKVAVVDKTKKNKSK